MRRFSIALLAVAGVVWAEGEGLSFTGRAYRVAPLQCEVGLPDGWAALQDDTGMIARDASDNGFLISREPLLRDPATFHETWKAALAPVRDVDVERAKVGKYVAWRTAWDGPDRRRIEIWRVWATENEMLYNFSFTGLPGFDLAALREGVFKQFAVTAAASELRLAPEPQTFHRTSIRIPVGYEAERVGALEGDFVLRVPGYTPPHEAGRIHIEVPARLMDTEKMVRALWRPEWGKMPRIRSAKVDSFKGDALEAEIVVGGVPKRLYAFAGKRGADGFVIAILVDERELRLHKNYFKAVLATVTLRG